ncbi:MAG: hypothetical protein HGB11_02795 [Chlorobiales bacterium]|nr:hypothetical protein [Chlorobiales bacterium]
MNARKKFIAAKIIYPALLSLIILVQSASSAFAYNDKTVHIGASAVFGIAGETYLHHTTDLNNRDKVFFGFILGLTPGVMKEAYDSTQKDKFFNGKDIAADIVGAFAGSLISNLVNNALWVTVDKSANNHVTLSVSYKF